MFKVSAIKNFTKGNLAGLTAEYSVPCYCEKSAKKTLAFLLENSYPDKPKKDAFTSNYFYFSNIDFKKTANI